MVKILIELEAGNPDRPNNNGRTPLSFSSANGHEEVVKILLEQEEVNPSRADSGGQTPFMYAVRHGRQRMIRLLQPYEAVAHGALPELRDTTP